MVTELKYFPSVRQPDGTNAYGGSQDWFPHIWRRMSGCAAVSAVNLAAYDGVGMKPDLLLDETASFSKDYYTEWMNLMFQEHMTTGTRGFPDPDKYTEEFLRYAASHGVSYEVEKQYKREHTKEAVAFILDHLRKSRPVIQLILNHHEKTIDDIAWHWLTITGYDDLIGDIIVSNYGRRERWHAASLYETKQEDEVYLLAFGAPQVAEKESA